MQKFIKNILAMVLLTAALGSCITEKKRQKICNTCQVKDSTAYREVIKLKDTTIYITQPGPIQWLENPCKLLCDSLGNLKPFEVNKHTGGLNSTIKTNGNHIEFNCDADSLKAIIKGLKEREVTKVNNKTVIKELPCNNEKTTFDGFCRWWFYITSVILIFIIGWRYIKRITMGRV